MNRGGFSWKRFTGYSAMKSRVSRKIGVPLSRSGRYQKVGRMVSGKGCLMVVLSALSLTLSFGLFLILCFWD
jgi:hypothetical protein